MEETNYVDADLSEKIPDFVSRIIESPLTFDLRQCALYADTTSMDHGIVWFTDFIIGVFTYDTQWTVAIMDIHKYCLLHVIFIDSHFHVVDEVDLLRVDYHSILDLSQEGDRWEGAVLDGKPYGYGCLYTADDVLAYCGFLLDSVKTGYGVEYYTDMNALRVEYEGTFVGGKHHGIGELKERDGTSSGVKLWLDNELESSRRDGLLGKWPSDDSDDDSDGDNTEDSNDDSYDDDNNMDIAEDNEFQQLDFHIPFHRLIFPDIPAFHDFHAIPPLHEFILGDPINDNPPIPSTNNDNQDSENNTTDDDYDPPIAWNASWDDSDITLPSYLSDTFLTVSITSLTLSKSNGFTGDEFPFHAFKQLERIYVGSGCFKDVNRCVLEDMPFLESVRFGYGCYTHYVNAWSKEIDQSRTFVCRHCPKLKELIMMASAFSVFYQCTIENLPSLRVIVFGTGRTMSNVFCQCPSLTIDNLPKLSTLHFGGQSFFAVETLQISSRVFSQA